MFRNSPLLIVFMGLLAGPALAQDYSSNQTGGFNNGRAWSKLDANNRLTYCRGIETGLTLTALVILSDTKEIDRVTSHQAEKFQTGDWVKGIDQFYSEVANIRIPIIYAWEYVNQKLKGAPGQDLDALMHKYRVAAASEK